MSENNFSKVFISHASEDEELAKAWQHLIQRVTGDKIKPWYSGYNHSDGGIKVGDDWRLTITKALEYAEIIIVILTPGSVENSWVHYEVGYARGQGKKILPVIHFLESDKVHSIFKTMTPQTVHSQDKEKIFKLLVSNFFLGQEATNIHKATWDRYYKEFRKKIVQEGIAFITRTHFQDHFHNFKNAKKLLGTWMAKWTTVHEDGREEIFEKDGLYIWTTESRIRMVGANQKKGIETMKQVEYKYYPMEGVVSSKTVALSYWSAGTITICGTCLLRRKGISWRKLSGHWQGYTTLNIDDDPTFMQGHIEMDKIDDKFLAPDNLNKQLKKFTAEKTNS